ncbi:MAG: LamG-like jellyroll fold domain-containing protein, partial [Verrucomicrobiota bacterium]
AAQELRLWQAARSLDEILRWQASSIIPADAGGLIGYWRANEGEWPRLENLGSKGDPLDGIFQGVVGRVDALSNLGVVRIPEKAASYAVSLPAFNSDTSGANGLTYEIIRQPSDGVLGAIGAGQVLYSPRAGFGGTDTLSYRVKNGSVASETVAVSLKMEVIDDPPRVSAIPNQVVYSAGGAVVVPFTVSDEETAAADLAVSVASSDPVVLPVASLELGGQGTSRTLSIAPQPGVFASSVVTITVTDGANSVQQAFTVQLAPTLAYRIIPLSGPVGTQVTQPTAIADDGRVGGFGDTLAGGVPKAFVNLGFLSGFVSQSGLLDQNNGRVNGLATANGLQVSVGDYLINGEWRAFLHNGGSLLNLGKPSGSSGSRATAVNASLQVVGYSTVGSNERAFLSTGNPDAFTDVSPAGTTTSRAVAINDRGDVLIRSGAAGAFKSWVRLANGTVTDLGAPAGHSSPNPLSITAEGAVMAEATGAGSRRLAQWQGGTWTLLGDAPGRWSYFDGGRMNGFGIAVGTARTNNPTGTPMAAVYTSGRWHALNDLIPSGSGWNLETASAINEDGMIVGTGRLRGSRSAFLAVPANIIGQRVPRPEGAVGRYPTIQILEGGVDDDDMNSFFWSELEKSLYAIRPVTARIRWFTTTDLGDTNNVTIPSLAANIWPREPAIHVASVPVETEPVTEGALYRFAVLAYSTDREAGVDPSTKKFNSHATNGVTYSVFHFLQTDGRSPDPLFQTNAFLVVRTLPWHQAPLNARATALVGQSLSHAGHQDYPGKNGHLFFTNSVVDVVGEQASYKPSDRSGALNVVNALANARNGNPSVVDPLVVWFEMTPYGIALPNRPVTYLTAWPTNASRVIIASGRGSNHDEADPITPSRYPEAHLYIQPDRALPGFNPNEEHALIAPSSLGNAAYALRNDLNAFRRFSEPMVLLKYRDPESEQWRIKPYQVVIEQAPWFLRFAGDAGKEIQPPIPLSLLPLTSRSHVSQGDWFRDYNAKLYARAAGPEGGLSTFVLRWFYPLQPNFFYDLNGDGAEDLPVGTAIPWLDRRTESVNGERGAPGTPIPTVYHIRWPDVPVLQVGQTLTTPVNGLPDVRNMAHVRMIFDSLDPAGQNGLTNLTRLFDPISERHVRLGSSFVLSPSIKTATDARGRHLFVDLPYALRVRLSFDPFNKWLYLGGFEDRANIGEPLVLPNILTPSERDTIKALAANASGTQRTQFLAAVDALYDLCRNPNRLDLDGDGIADASLLVGLTYGTNVTSVLVQGVRRIVTNAVPEVFAGGPKALTAADATVPPALASPGKALRFSPGSSQHLRIDRPKGAPEANGLAPGLRGSFTMEFWVRNAAGSSTDNTLVRLGTNPLKALKAGYRSGYFLFEFNTQRVRTEDPVLESDMNAWVHYALVHDADAQSATIYRNGAAVGYAEGFSMPLDPADGAPLYFGGDPATPAHVFSGLLDEIRLWDGVARRGSQLQAESRKKLAIGREGLWGYWRFDTASALFVPDDSDSGREGVLLATPLYEVPTDAPYGIPPRYVTLAENNDPSLGGLPVTLKMIEIDDGPYRGDLKVLP